MNKICIVIFVFCVFPQCLARMLILHTRNTYNVVNYGAKGNGLTDDSHAFLKAWADVCGDSGQSSTLIVPQGKTFLLQPLVFQGPCRSSYIYFEVLGSIVAPNGAKEWKGNRETWLQFSNIKGLVIDGKQFGSFDGKGSAWWGRHGCSLDAVNDLDCGASSRPTALYIHGCDDLTVKETTHINSPRNHMTINGCNGVDIIKVHIVAPEDSPNTDGINISQSTRVNIRYSVIQTGDDCIAISDGSSFVNIGGTVCGPGHGISIGSLGQNGQYQTVEEVHVRNCTLKGTQNGARIKTWPGGAGYARKISFEGILFEDSRNPIIIDQFYNNVLESSTGNNGVFISDVKFSHMYGTSASAEAIVLNCSNEKGCSRIKMDHINIRASSNLGESTFASCHNAHGTASYVTPSVSCLS